MSAARSTEAGEPARAVVRDVALEKSIQVERVIGVDGGVITIPQAGLVVEFHAGTFAQRTTVRITALEGQLVAYDIEADAPLVKAPSAYQQLEGTDAVGSDPSCLFAARFTSVEQLNFHNGTAIVTDKKSTTDEKGAAGFTIDRLGGFIITY